MRWQRRRHLRKAGASSHHASSTTAPRPEILTAVTRCHPPRKNNRLAEFVGQPLPPDAHTLPPGSLRVVCLKAAATQAPPSPCMHAGMPDRLAASRVPLRDTPRPGSRKLAQADHGGRHQAARPPCELCAGPGTSRLPSALRQALHARPAPPRRVQIPCGRPRIPCGLDPEAALCVNPVPRVGRALFPS